MQMIGFFDLLFWRVSTYLYTRNVLNLSMQKFRVPFYKLNSWVCPPPPLRTPLLNSL